MARRSLLLILAALGGCTALSCQFDQYEIDKPPRDAKEAARWWNNTIENTSLERLAVYVEVSDLHLHEGSTATYVWMSGPCHTMIARYFFESDLPVPPPAYALEQMRQRLAGYKPTDADKVRKLATDIMHAEDCRGCTESRAMEIWQLATETVAQRAASK